MAHARELVPKRKSRLQQMMEEDTVTDATLNAQVTEWAETIDLSSDWTTRSAHDYSLILNTADELDYFYQKYCLPSMPGYPPVMWDVPHPSHLTNVLTRYLLFKLNNTRGHHPSGKVRVKSFCDWARRLVFIAAYNIIGFGGRGKNRPYSVLRGEMIDKSDSQWQAVVVRFVQSTAVKYNLPTKRHKGMFWGPSELALMVRGIESKMLSLPGSAESFLQVKVAAQLALSCGVRTGSMAYSGRVHSGATNRFLMEDKVSFVQCEPGHYAMDIEFVVLKGLSKAGKDEDQFTPRLPPVTRISNLPLEAQSSIIPLLTLRRSLYHVVNGRNHVFTSIDEFLECRSMHFFVLPRDMPLIRKMMRKGGTHSIAPLTANSLNDKHKHIAHSLRLPRPRIYNYRKYHGSVIRATHGSEGQRVALNHKVQGDVGRTHYSRGVGDMPTAKTVLDENPDVESKFKDAGLRDREKDSPAVRAMLDIKRCGLAENFDGVTASSEEIDAAAAADGRYQTLLADLTKLTEDRMATEANPGLDDEILNAKQQLAAQKSRVGTVVKRRKHRENLKSVAYTGGTVREFAEAKAAIDNLRASPPLLLTATANRNEDFSSLWPTATISIEDGCAPFLERMEDDETLDASSWAYLDEATTVVREDVQRSAATYGFDGKTSGGVENDEYENDESDDEAEDEDGPAPVCWSDYSEGRDSTPEELRAARAEYMRRTYRLLTVNAVRETIANFIVEHGYCPLCPLGEVGVQPLVNGGNPYNDDITTRFGHTLGGILNVRNPDSPMCVTRTLHGHFEKKHSAEWALINAGIMPPTLSDYLAEFTEAEHEAALHILDEVNNGDWHMESEDNDEVDDAHLLAYLRACYDDEDVVLASYEGEP